MRIECSHESDQQLADVVVVLVLDVAMDISLKHTIDQYHPTALSVLSPKSIWLRMNSMMFSGHKPSLSWTNESA